MIRAYSFFVFVSFSLSGLGQLSSTEYLIEYNRAAESGKMNEALSICKKWTENHPESVEAKYRYAKALSKKGLRSESIEKLQELLSIDSVHVPSLLFLAEVKKQDDHSAGLELYEELIQIEPTNAFFYREAAECAVESQAFDKGMSYYLLSHQLDSSDIITMTGFARLLIDFKQFEDADSLLTQTLRMDEKNLFARMTKAQLAFAREDWKAVTEWIEPIAESDPPKTAFKYLGIAYYHLGKYEESIEVMRYLSNVMNTLDYPHYYMGLALEKQGYTDMARVQYQQAVNKALSPNLATYYERLGLMLQEENDHAEAIKAFKMALQFSARNMLNFHLAKSFDIYYQDSTSAKNQYELFLEREGEAESPERNFAEKRLAQIKKEAHFLAE